jgi:hypothetical protein
MNESIDLMAKEKMVRICSKTEKEEGICSRAIQRPCFHKP